MTRPLWLKAITACVGAIALMSLGLLVLVVGIDHGVFNGQIERLATSKAGRVVRFASLRTSLLLPTPSFAIEGLVVGSPPAISHDDLAHISRLTGRMKLLPLLMGRLELVELTVWKPELNLVRLGRARNNYSFGRGGSSDPFRSTQRLIVVDGQVHYENRERSATLVAAFSHDGRAGVAMPFQLTGGGIAHGEPYTLSGVGGPLNGRAPGQPYAFSTEIGDGDLRVSLSGTSKAPFDFSGFAMSFKTTGPNLADYTYLFGATAPNSPPFALAGRAQRHDQTIDVSDVVGIVGRSDVRAKISFSALPSNKMIRATISSNTLYASDMQAVLSALPTHDQTRARPGSAARSRGPSDRLFSSKPFKLEPLRELDLILDVKAAKTVGVPISGSDFIAHLEAKNDQVAIAPLNFDTAPGRFSGAVRFDGHAPRPSAVLTGSLVGARLDRLRPSLNRTIDADFDLWFNVRAQGSSPHAMAADAQGRIAFDLKSGRLQRSKAAALSGDLVQAVGLALGDKKSSQIPLTCAVGTFQAANGHLQVRQLEIVTGAGVTQGTGDIDLAGEDLNLEFRGMPARRRILQIGAPISIQGPVRHPVVGVETAAAVRKAGAAGVLAFVATPFAAVLPFAKAADTPLPACGPLLADSAAFVRYP